MKMAKRLLALLLALTMLLTLALPAGATELHSSACKKAINQVLSSKVDHFGSGYVYPFASFYNATLVEGDRTLLRFRRNKDMSCPDDYLFCLTIFRGSSDQLDTFDESDIIEERVIPLSDFSAYGNGDAIALTWSADTRYSAGEYTAICFTMDSEGYIDSEQLIYISSLHVLKKNTQIPATDLELCAVWGGNFYPEISDTYAWNTRLYLLPVLYPLNTTSPKNFHVSTTNSNFVYAAMEDEFIVLYGENYAAPATITVSCGNLSASFEVMFGEVPTITAVQGKTTLCPDELDTIVFSPNQAVHHFISSDTSVVRTIDDGRVFGVGPGTATVTLTMGYQSVSFTYTVVPHELPEDTPIIGTAPTATKSVYQIGKCAVCGKEDAINILQPAIFSDTSPNAWYSDHVDYAYEHNIFTGVTANEFKPNQALTRGQMATVLYRIAGSPEVSTECPFTDVKSGRYYYNAILWAAENGIVTGYTDQTFRPDNLITREQIATILYRYVQYTGTEIAGDPALLETFPDAYLVSNYAKPSLAWAVQEGLITGVGTEWLTCLKPQNNATRAQVATILSRYLNTEPTEA